MYKLSLRFSGIWVVLLLVGLLLVPTCASAQESDGKAVVKVMTYNVNEGTDFLEVLSATDLLSFVNAVQTTLDNIDSTNPPLRMQAIAHEIAQTEPDLVGLQEVTTWSVGGEVRYDMLQELLDALQALGEPYDKVLIVDEFQLQGLLPDFVTTVEGVNHDVILARTDRGLSLTNLRKDKFTYLLSLDTAVGPFQIVRGWGSVDVTLHGRSFRFVVSHLEQFIAAAPPTLLLQEAQAVELIQQAEVINPGRTTPLPLIIAVDTNADALGNDPTIATYQLIRSFGFDDAWAAIHPDQPGATWGFMQDPNDPRPTIYQRIDDVFFNDAFRALTSQRAGQLEEEKIDGLWPSDHAGVRAGLLLLGSE